MCCSTWTVYTYGTCKYFIIIWYLSALQHEVLNIICMLCTHRYEHVHMYIHMYMYIHIYVHVYACIMHSVCSKPVLRGQIHTVTRCLLTQVYTCTCTCTCTCMYMYMTRNTVDSLVCGDSCMAVLAHANWDLEAHGRVGRLVLRALATHCTTTLATVMLQWRRGRTWNMQCIELQPPWPCCRSLWLARRINFSTYTNQNIENKLFFCQTFWPPTMVLFSGIEEDHSSWYWNSFFCQTYRPPTVVLFSGIEEDHGSWLKCMANSICRLVYVKELWKSWTCIGA